MNASPIRVITVANAWTWSPVSDACVLMVYTDLSVNSVSNFLCTTGLKVQFDPSNCITTTKLSSG